MTPSEHTPAPIAENVSSQAGGATGAGQQLHWQRRVLVISPQDRQANTPANQQSQGSDTSSRTYRQTGPTQLLDTVPIPGTPLLREDGIQQQTHNGAQYQRAYLVEMPFEPHSAHPGRLQAVVGIVSGLIALLIAPILFGPVGITLGAVAKKRGAEGTAVAAIIVSIIGMMLGILLGMIAYMDGVALQGIMRALFY